MQPPYAFEIGDRIEAAGELFVVAGFRKMIGMPVEYCLRTPPGPSSVDMWMTVPEINAWTGVEPEPSM